MPILISMHSYRGGTGKSNLTAYLAVSMVRQGIGISELLVVLLRPDKRDSQCTAITLEVTRKLGVEQVLLVVNKVVPSPDGESLKQHIQQTYNSPVIGVLPISEKIARTGSLRQV